jgi:hypothetical protein
MAEMTALKVTLPEEAMKLEELGPYAQFLERMCTSGSVQKREKCKGRTFVDRVNYDWMVMMKHMTKLLQNRESG